MLGGRLAVGQSYPVPGSENFDFGNATLSLLFRPTDFSTSRAQDQGSTYDIQFFIAHFYSVHQLYPIL